MTVVHSDRKMEDLGRLQKLLAISILGLKQWMKIIRGIIREGHDEVLDACEICGEIEI